MNATPSRFNAWNDPVTLPSGLLEEVTAAGYLPNVVVNMMRIACAGEAIIKYIVLPETSVNHHGVRQHLTVVLVTPTRLITGHVDDFDGESEQVPVATSRTDSTRLRDIRNVSIAQVFAEPTRVTPDQLPNEISVSVSWGNARRTEIEPADCGDPQCEGDHGFTALGAGEDLVMTVSFAQDGAQKILRLMEFAAVLSAAMHSESQ